MARSSSTALRTTAGFPARTPRCSGSLRTAETCTSHDLSDDWLSSAFPGGITFGGNSTDVDTIPGDVIDANLAAVVGTPIDLVFDLGNWEVISSVEPFVTTYIEADVTPISSGVTGVRPITVGWTPTQSSGCVFYTSYHIEGASTGAPQELAIKYLVQNASEVCEYRGTGEAICGNNVVDFGDEFCDGTDVQGYTCADLGFTGGTLACLSDCSYFDTSNCTEPACGDNVAGRGEFCDGTDLQGLTCANFGFTGGTLACLSDCSYFDTSNCEGEVFCGDNVAEGGEFCDGTDLQGLTCANFGFTGGTLACRFDCSFVNTSSCTGGPECGDNVAEGGEFCDGTDLQGLSCADLGFTGGTLACLSDCSYFDTSNCTFEPAVCGDNVAEGGEFCDGTDLQGLSCADLGFTGGTLACLSDCSYFDTSNCEGEVFCGNNVVEFGEFCDGTDLQGLSCADLGFTGGTLACLSDCSYFDTSNCTFEPAVCGDNVAEGGEFCDGTDLQGFTCVDFGLFTGGTLACASNCNPDVSGCTGLTDNTPPVTFETTLTEAFGPHADFFPIGASATISYDLYNTIADSNPASDAGEYFYATRSLFVEIPSIGFTADFAFGDVYVYNTTDFDDLFMFAQSNQNGAVLDGELIEFTELDLYGTAMLSSDAMPEDLPPNVTGVAVWFSTASGDTWANFGPPTVAE